MSYSTERMTGVLEPQSKLAKLMYAQGLTQTALAKAIGVSQVSISRWLNGTRYPSPANAQAVADHLGKPAKKVWTYELKGQKKNG